MLLTEQACITPQVIPQATLPNMPASSATHHPLCHKYCSCTLYNHYQQRCQLDQGHQYLSCIGLIWTHGRRPNEISSEVSGDKTGLRTALEFAHCKHHSQAASIIVCHVCHSHTFSTLGPELLLPFSIPNPQGMNQLRSQ